MFHFGSIAQLGFVVHDLDEAIKSWTDFHRVGPFFRADEVRPEHFVHRGDRHDVVFAAAMANSGPLQIELIQPLDSTPSLWQEFLDAGRVGLQHLGIWTENFDADFAAAERQGYHLAHQGVLSGGRFAYFDPDTATGYAIELSEQSPEKSAIFGAIRRAAVDWDGKNPVRPWSEAVSAASLAAPETDGGRPCVQ